MNKARNFLKQMLAAVLMTAMILTMIPLKFGMRGNAEAAIILSNPRIVPDSSMNSGQITTWDCVWK